MAYSVQPVIAPKVGAKAWAHALIAWMNHSRVPADFKEPEGTPWDPAICRRQLRKFVDSWIEAEFMPTKWPYWKRISKLVVVLEAGSSYTINTTISYRTKGKHKTSTADEWENYEPPADTEEAARQAEILEEETVAGISLWKAETIFFMFLCDEDHRTLIGQCLREGCRRYFVNMTGQQGKRFCTTRCAHIASAMKSKRDRNEARMSRLREEIRQLMSQHDNEEELKDRLWKRVKHDRTHNISRNFITRHIEELVKEERSRLHREVKGSGQQS
jgi:hypothetical protein